MVQCKEASSRSTEIESIHGSMCELTRNELGLVVQKMLRRKNAT